MDIQTIEYKHCDLVKPSGRIDSSTAPQFYEALSAINEKGRFRIVIDFSDVSFISSAGLRVLVNAQKNCKRFNRGEIVLAAVPANIHSALELAGFTMLFRIFPDSISAVGNF